MNSDRLGAVAMLRCQCSLTEIACEPLGVQFSGKRWFLRVPEGTRTVSKQLEGVEVADATHQLPGLLVPYMPLAD